VVEASRRNRNFHVLLRPGGGLFVKQVQAWDASSTQAVKREAFCYWLAGGDPDFAVLATVVPKYRHYDPSRNVLVTELVPGDSLQSQHQRDSRFPPGPGAALGRQLARWHRALTAEMVHGQPLEKMGQLSAGNSQLLAVLQRYPDFPRWLEELRSRWKVECLIHGDIKWDNCLLETPASNEGEVRLRVVDWELADLGDPAWDLGAALQAYLSWWIFSMQPGAGLSPAQLESTARTPLSAVQPAMRALWNAYAESTGLDDADATTLLEHTVSCAAARMVQTVYEHMQFSAQLTPQSICLLQVSLNMLQSPSRARRELLAF
jgi:hypothetical protein